MSIILPLAHTLSEEEVVSKPWKIYPNPSTGLVTLQTNAGSEGNSFTLKASNMTGQVVRTISGNVQGGLIQLDLQDQVAGLYVLELVENNKKTTFKIAIQ